MRFFRVDDDCIDDCCWLHASLKSVRFWLTFTWRNIFLFFISSLFDFSLDLSWNRFVFLSFLFFRQTKAHTDENWFGWIKRRACTRITKRKRTFKLYFARIQRFYTNDSVAFHSLDSFSFFNACWCILCKCQQIYNRCVIFTYADF